MTALNPGDDAARGTVSAAEANELVRSVWPASAGRDADGIVTVAGVRLDSLAERYGTPLYLIDEREVRERATRTREAFEAAAMRAGTTVRVYYAGKALLTTDVVRWVVDAGLGVDVCSEGELAVALAGGADPASIGYHGNNKSRREIDEAVRLGIGSIVVDSDQEIERVAQIAEELSAVQAVRVRVNSGVHAETHDYLATSHEDQKFGFAVAAAEAAVDRIRQLPSLRFDGLHCHIGSQIFGGAGFRESARRMVELYAKLRSGGDVPVLNLGGGFGIAYTAADTPSDIEVLAAEIVGAVRDACDLAGVPLPALAFEPGRSIVGPAGVTLYEVGTVKPVALEDGAGRVYVSVDGGMSDNARPALYGADYSARIVSRASDAPGALSRVVGKHCEAGDIVVQEEYLPADIAPGDLLAVPATGAYCFSLSSNYNFLPRPPLVAVADGAARPIVRGERIEDLLARDLGAQADGDKGER